jgi:hypothetical protein
MARNGNTTGDAWSDWIRYRLRELDLSQVELARAIGVTEQTVVYWCAPMTNRWASRPPRTKAALLAGILVVPEHDLRRRMGAAKIALDEYRGLHTRQHETVPA